MTSDEIFSMLIQAEWQERQNRKTERNIKQAHFRYQATLEQMVFTAQRTLDKNMLIRLSYSSFIKRTENIVVSGPTGVEKTSTATALGLQACLMGYPVFYCNLQKLFTGLKIAKTDGS